MKFFTTIFLVCSVFLMSFQFSHAQSDINKFDKNGKRHGVWKKKYNNGRIRYSGKFVHGKEVGAFKYYSPVSSEFPVAVREYNESNNKANVKFYTKKGLLESKGMMIGKKRIGKWLFFNTDGKTVLSEENYVDGKLHGPYKTFYNDGKPTEIASYKNGKLDGAYKKYAIKGHIYQNLNYSNGLLNGEAKYYSRKTGELVTKGQFKDDKRVGTWENYADGELVSKEQPNKKKPRRKITPKKKKKN